MEPNPDSPVRDFSNKEYEEASRGLESLIQKLERTEKTLNPQDSARAQIKEAIQDLHETRKLLDEAYEKVSDVKV